MNFMTKYLMGQFLLMDEAGAGEGGKGGGAGDQTPPSTDNAALMERLEKMESINAKLLTRIEAMAPGEKPPAEDPTLADKAKAEREKNEAAKASTSVLQQAIKFNLTAPEWLKTNEALLPPTVAGIFEAAEKENYASDQEKAQAIKVGIVQEYFAQQSNLDLLTETQKNQLAEFNNLTKNVKQERVNAIYDAIFEPAFENVRRSKKAEQLANGLGSPSDAEAAHKKKMIDASTKKFLGGI